MLVFFSYGIFPDFKRQKKEGKVFKGISGVTEI
jgi:hypothetical protein